MSSAFTVAIDAGHGGMDRGATAGKIHESTVALGISRELLYTISKNPEFKAFLVRENDTQVELHDRLKIAKKKKSDIFVSIHANSSPDPNSHGMEVYFRNELEPDQDSLRLANQENQLELIKNKNDKNKGDMPSILTDLQRSHSTLKSYEMSWHIVENWKVPFSRTRSLPIKQGPFHVINDHSVPAILIEVGFITNSKEAKRLVTPSYQREIAQAIFKGLQDFKETLDKGQTKALK